MPSAESLRRITLALLVLGCLFTIVGTALPSWLLEREGTLGLWQTCRFDSRYICRTYQCWTGACTVYRVFMVIACLGVTAATVVMFLKYFKFPERVVLLRVTIGCSAVAALLTICSMGAFVSYCVSIFNSFRSGAGFFVTAAGMILTISGTSVAGGLVIMENKESESVTLP